MSIITDIAVEQIAGKKWYVSKTVWTNIIAAAFIGVQMKYGFLIPADWQMLILSAINAGLRKVTKEEIIW